MGGQHRIGASRATDHGRYAAQLSASTALIDQTPECLEYIVVHELVQLLAPTHNARFSALFDLYLPHWQHLRKQLNRLRASSTSALVLLV